MGKRVHVVKRQPEYGNTEGFNWKYGEFHLFLALLSDNVTGDYFDESWEMPAEDFKRIIDFVKKFIKTNTDEKLDELCDEYGIEKEEFVDAVYDMETTTPKLLETLKGFYKERDKHSNWIQFHAW